MIFLGLTVTCDDPRDPLVVVPHFGVDSWVVGIGTAYSPGHNAFQKAIAHERSPRITLWKAQVYKNIVF